MKHWFRFALPALLGASSWMGFASAGLPQSSTSQASPQTSSTPSTSSTSSASSPSSPTTAKKKKVWTEDDLRAIHGGVSVVGEADKPPAKKAPGKKTAGDEAKAELPLPEEAPAAPPCKSWSWAAEVDAVLSAQGVNLGRPYWVQKSYGGEICTTELGNLATLASRVAGDYTLDDGTKVRIKAEAYPSFTSNNVAAQEATGIMSIVIYKGHPYLSTDYTGVKWVNSVGAVAGYELQTMTMEDPYEGRTVRYDRARDNPVDFQGSVWLSVTRL